MRVKDYPYLQVLTIVGENMITENIQNHRIIVDINILCSFSNKLKEVELIHLFFMLFFIVFRFLPQAVR